MDKEKQRRITKFWHQCQPTGPKRRRNSLIQTTSTIPNLSMIAQPQTKDFSKCFLLLNLSIFLKHNRSLTNFLKPMALNPTTLSQRVRRSPRKNKSRNTSMITWKSSDLRCRLWLVSTSAPEMLHQLASRMTIGPTKYESMSSCRYSIEKAEFLEFSITK